MLKAKYNLKDSTNLLQTNFRSVWQLAGKVNYVFKFSNGKNVKWRAHENY